MKALAEHTLCHISDLLAGLISLLRLPTSHVGRVTNCITHGARDGLQAALMFSVCAHASVLFDIADH